MIDDGDDDEVEGGGNEVEGDECERVAGIEGTLLVEVVDLVSGLAGRRFAHQMRTVVSSEALAIMLW